MAITDFLKDENNSVTREKIFLDRVMFDLKLAAAHARIPLQIFIPDVDRDGYDIIVDDASLERRFQLKSFLKSSPTANWKIYKRLLRPTMHHALSLGFELSPEGVGIEGGVILIQIEDSDPACPVTYSYTDIFVLTVLGDGLIVPEQKKRKKQALKVLRGIHSGKGRERILVPLGAFLPVRSPSCLLSIAGFHSTENSYCWWGNLLTALRDHFRLGETDRSTEPAARALTAHAHDAIRQLLSLVDDPSLRSFKKEPSHSGRSAPSI
jgi:hypothetical protein